MKKFAFTLAEVLIVLGIIGVIAAMTIPILASKYMNRIYSTQLKNTTSELSTAIQNIISDESANTENFEMYDESSGNMVNSNVEEGFYSTNAGMRNSSASTGAQYFLVKYLNITASNCAGRCTAPSYTNSNGTSIGGVPSEYYCVITKKGAVVCMKYENNYQNVIMDINGEKHPNVSGRDLFVMRINSNGDLEDYTDDGNQCNHEGEGPNKIIKFASGCFQKVISNDWQIE